MLDTPEAKKIFKSCHRFLTHDYRLGPTLLPNFNLFELTVGEATLDLNNQEIVTLFQLLLTRAGA